MARNKPSNKIDWAHWKRQQEVRIWEAVFLSLGVNPEMESDDYSEFIDSAPSDAAAEIRKRLRTLQAGACDRKYFSPSTLNAEDANLWCVRLGEFAAWCASVEYQIPSELAAMAQTQGAGLGPLNLNAGSIPEFVIEARPLQVPPGLAALPADQVVRFSGKVGNTQSSTQQRAGDFVAKIETQIKRQAEGFFTVEEAAQLLADSRDGMDAAKLIDQMKGAFAQGKLPIRDFEHRLPHRNASEVRDFHSLVKVSDIDAWLEALGAGYCFPAAATPIDMKPGTGRRPPLPKQRYQEEEILRVITELGYQPAALPKRVPGKAGVKAAVRKTLRYSDAVFDKAWGRLRQHDEIKDAP